jgi:4-diphosphocytidyl-2-C-methyl-D-erythritol kinase
VHVADVIANGIDDWKDNLVNDFEKSVFQAHPEIAHIKSRMYAHGAVYAAMSGSGSAVYGIFKEDPSEFDGYKEMIKWSSKLGEP